MPISRANVLQAISAGALLLGGCAHPAYGPSSDARLDSAVKDSQVGDNKDMQHVTAEDLESKKCTGYRADLIKAKNDELPEVDRLAKFESLYKDLKSKNDYLEGALAANPDLQFESGSKVPKLRDECRDALADVRQDYYAFVSDIAQLLVVKDVHGNAAPRLNFDKFRTAIEVLNPDDRDQLLARVDSAEHRIRSAPPPAPRPPPTPSRHRR